MRKPFMFCDAEICLGMLATMRKLQKQNTDFGNGPHPGSSPDP